MLSLDMSCKWNRPAKHAARCKQTDSFCSCSPRLVGSGLYPFTSRDGLLCWWRTMAVVFFCSGTVPPCTPRRPRCSRAHWPRSSPTLAMFSADQFHCFPAWLFLCWHRVAALWLRCPQESEVVAASPARVPGLSAARPSLGRHLLTRLPPSPGCSHKGVFSYL